MSEDRAKALERIQKLIRLATNNPSENEARIAAFQAVKLMDEHGFTVGEKAVPTKPVVRPDANPHWQYPPASPYVGFDDFAGENERARAVRMQQDAYNRAAADVWERQYARYWNTAPSVTIEQEPPEKPWWKVF